MSKETEQQAEVDYSYLNDDTTEDGSNDIGADNIKICLLYTSPSPRDS